MKHLREFDDQEIQDLMGDLETVGHEQLKGWYMQTTSSSGEGMGRMIFAHNEEELVKIFGKEFIQKLKLYTFTEIQLMLLTACMLEKRTLKIHLNILKNSNVKNFHF